ncbi:MAG: BamA/TamA family outer membrane protein [Myxococcota bacterium]|nr:BamA/TamA family outer membrane protein [Myxococcota bacterium]
MLVVCTGCSALWQGRTYVEPTVRSIEFEEQRRFFRGVRGTSDYTLRTAMSQKSSPLGAHFVHVIERQELDLAVLEADARRLELWYAHHGFFDARFLGWEIRTVRSARHWRTLIHRNWEPYPEVVKIRGVIREGPESTVRSIRFEGLEDVPALAGAVRRRTPVTVGERFDLEVHRETIQAVQVILHNASFARAEVQGEIHALPEERAVDLVYRVSGVGAGKACQFGEVTIEGADRVPMALVPDAVRVESGRAFSSKSLSETQLEVFSLGAFSLVQVKPDLSGDQPVVPVAIKVTESRFKELKLGPGLGLQNGEQLVRLGTHFSHSNFLERLVSLDAGIDAGLKTFVRPTDLGEGGGVQPFAEDLASFADAEAALTVPGVFGTNLSARQSLEFQVDEDPGNRFSRWDVSPSISWPVTRKLSLVFAYHFENWSGDLDSLLAEREPLADLPDSYRLSSVEQRLLLDRRNDPIRTRQGSFADFSATEAGLGTGYRFLRLKADMRTYLDTRRWRRFLGPAVGVAAARLAGGIAVPHEMGGAENDSLAYVPYAERFLLGGGSTVRGWMPDRLGPLVCEDVQLLSTCLPEGGQVALWGSLEYRMDGPLDSAFAGFLDVGQAWRTPGEFDLAQLQPSAGLGFRYATPIGPVRLDLAFRLRVDEGPVQHPVLNLHFGLSEAF